MKLRFLCATHRQALSDNPGQAIHCWQNGLDTGQILYEQLQWKEALPHLGCAMETSEIILTTRAVDLKNACQLLTSSAVLTANTLLKLGNQQDSRDVLDSTINRLERELNRSPNDKNDLLTFISCLYECLKNIDRFKQEILPKLNTRRDSAVAQPH